MFILYHDRYNSVSSPMFDRCNWNITENYIYSGGLYSNTMRTKQKDGYEVRLCIEN